MDVIGQSRKPRTRQTLPQRVAAQLKQRIVAGEFPPGSYLPSLRELQQQLGVSRRTVSAAFEDLQSMGLVIIRQGRGTEVITPGRSETSHGQVLILSDAPPPDAVSASESRRLIEGIVESLSSFGYVGVHHESGDLTGDLERDLEPYTGVIFQEAGADYYADLAVRMQQMGAAVVIANLEIGPLPTPIAHTCVDHHAIAKQATAMLLDLGHRRIAYVGREPTRYFYAKSLAGYRAALAEAGIMFDEDLVETPTDPPLLSGYRGALRMLTTDDPPTAFVTARDNYAQGVWSAVEEAGMVVGSDVSIIGYDNISWPTDEPELTTFQEPAREMGAEAARMLVDRMVGGPHEPERRVFDAPLVLRRSAGPCLKQSQSDDRVLQSRRQLAASLLGIEKL